MGKNKGEREKLRAEPMTKESRKRDWGGAYIMEKKVRKKSRFGNFLAFKMSTPIKFKIKKEKEKKRDTDTHDVSTFHFLF